ncbi:MAG TPA: DNA polymerase Y family protein [Polyangiaceae bacterium]|jgi:protein ImuB|nr:DNA polymerase Y family protein [Polyangiaceae bacterium]
MITGALAQGGAEAGAGEAGGAASQPRRLVAIVVPKLLLELARAALVVPARAKAPRQRLARRVTSTPPLGVLLVESLRKPAVARAAKLSEAEDEGKSGELEPLPPTAELAAVDDVAARFGVRVGHTMAEAHAFVAKLVVREVTREQVLTRLGEIAEVALGFGPLVSIESPDTVWVDVTGAAHLAGGEGALGLELAARVRALGHSVRVAVSDGPRLAQSFARWGRLSREGVLVVPPAETATRVAALPVRALPVHAERAAWLLQLGVVTVGDLAKLPRAATASRLGEDAGKVLDLAEGKDISPLVAYVPKAIPREESTWDDPVDGMEPLLFVMRGLVSRLGARLEGRGEAVQALELCLLHDRASARLAAVSPTTSLHFEFAAPLYRAEELFRVLASRLGRTTLSAPTVGLRLEARAITRALALQLPLSRYAAGLGGSSATGPETLPVLLAELNADLGKDRVGILQLQSSHRPERKSRLSPVTPAMLGNPGLKKTRERRAVQQTLLEVPEPKDELGRTPVRLLPRPIPFDAPLRRGATVSVEHRLYTVESVIFDRRLEAVEWWTSEPVSRDYLRVWLQNANGGLEALVFVDRGSGKRMIQGFLD